MRRFVISLAVAAALAACSDRATSPTQKGPALTQRQHDSVIGQSGLPGAMGVRSALRVSDSLDARRARIDSASRAP
jgi:nitrous oxide reductase accessory protein NosL